ncbi:MAG TPA: type VI secretion system baseplate subunit TssF [Gammaproteobacteria bacterium]|nr:type VI secretion system baseplate subunit TssF [Gammaproteobacteria bacterium]
MDDEIVKFYKKELNYIRQSAEAFAAANPKIAGRLRLSKDTIEDPHVSRLIESVAFLNARVRKKLDDSFPEICNSMLEVMYPHYLSPVPSMAIVQFEGLPELTGEYHIPRGASIETEAIDGEPCRFQTTYPVDLWPITVDDAQLIRGAYKAPHLPKHLGAVAVLRLKLSCLSEDVDFSMLAPQELVFHLRGQGTQTNQLYELILNNAVALAIANDASDPDAVFFDPEHIQGVGFDKDEGLLPYPARSLPAYRLLTEFFVFPEKFNFVKLANLGERAFKQRQNKLALYIYLNDSFVDLENVVNADSFLLGCTPMVNLFSQYAESITLSHQQEEYCVVPDSRRLLAKEIYSIDHVETVSPSGETVQYQPFYGFKHQQGAEQKPAYWHANRKPAKTDNSHEIDEGTELFISLVNLNFQEDIPDNWVLNVKTTCLNRDLPGRLPFGGGQPRLQLAEGNAPLQSIACITAPTKTLRIELQENTRWRLISHLNLNHLSLMDAENGADVLREILSLYNFNHSPSTRSMIEGVLSITHRQVMARVKDKGMSALCRGVEITLTLDEDRFEGQGLFLFGSVLERFFALYAPMNSFTKLVLKSKRREQAIKTWPPRAGEKVLL